MSGTEILPPYTEELSFDIFSIPFSRFGSYLAVSWIDSPKVDRGASRTGVWIRSVHGYSEHEVFHVKPIAAPNDQRVHSDALSFELHAGVSELRLTAGKGVARLCIDETDRIRVRVEGCGVRLTMAAGEFNSAVQIDESAWTFNAYNAREEFTAKPLSGIVRVDAPWEVAKCTYVAIDVLPGSDGIGECVLHEDISGEPLPATYLDYETARSRVEAEFEAFFRAYPKPREEYRGSARLASYVNWASVVGVAGNLSCPTMLMSKNWMTKVWSWDHCFNAMALAGGMPQMAWDQFMLMFEHRTAEGRLPDSIDDAHLHFNFTKPPIHGWAYRYMMQENDYFAVPAHVQTVYHAIAAWTRWWLNHRNPERDGLPRYHHGNDSGWDNGTVFDIGLPVRGSDLAALLAVQMDVLAELARLIGRENDALEWEWRSERSVQALLEKLWIGSRFVNPHAFTGEYNQEERSIISCVPIILGSRLPADVRAAVVERIRDNLTEWGPATESPESQLYEPDGYWRGPIWAPPTILLIDGLRRAGEHELAATLATRFIRLCDHSGFAENFDALTGEPLRDTAYTWTSSVFLLLAREDCSAKPE